MQRKLGIYFLRGVWVFLFLLVSCDKDSAAPVDIPTVVLNCQVDGCDASVTVTSALVFFSKSGCTNDFDISASATASFACAVDGCEGSANSWIDSSGEEVTSLPEGTYDLCVLVDRDGNSTAEEPYSPGDIVYESSVYVGSSSEVIANGDAWRQVGS